MFVTPLMLLFFEQNTAGCVCEKYITRGKFLTYSAAIMKKNNTYVPFIFKITSICCGGDLRYYLKVF